MILQKIVVAVIGLLSVIVTSVVVPLIKSKLTNSQWESICNYAVAGVQAARDHLQRAGQRSREVCLGQGLY